MVKVSKSIRAARRQRARKVAINRLRIMMAPKIPHLANHDTNHLRIT
jgi:hypothetical protein